MTLPLKKIPTLIVIGVTGFVAYTILFADGDSGPPKVNRKPSPADKDKSIVTSTTIRNPFLMNLASAAKASTAEPEPTKETAKTSTEGHPGELPVMSSEEDQVIGSMRLVGTFVDAREQLAIIDGKVYLRGDQLRGADGSMLPYVVTDVRKDRAMVRRGRRDFVIAFSDVPRSAGPLASTRPNPAEEKSATKAETVAKFTPIARGKKGPASTTGTDNSTDSDPAAQRDMLMQLLSTMAGQGGGTGGGGAAGPNPLAGLGSATGSNSSSMNSLINPATLGAGLDAIMGKGDNIGQTGGSGP